MKLTLIQGAFLLVFGLLLVRVCLLIARSAIPRGRGIIWLGIWSIGLGVVVKPDVSIRLAKLLGVSRGTDAVVYLAIAFLSVLVFRAFTLLDMQDKQLSKLTTALALKEWEKRELSEPEAPGTSGGAAEGRPTGS